MKFIGIIGGMSPESTAHYYKKLAQRVNELAGGQNSPELMIRSVNFEVYCELMKRGDWDKITRKIYREAKKLVDVVNCEYVAIATNTMHKAVENELFADIPLVHIGDCVAKECIDANVGRVALLGTKTTMKEDFMKKRLKDNCVEVVEAFSDEEIDRIDSIIFGELCHGKVTPQSKEYLIGLCENLFNWKDPMDDPIEGIILGCTELDMILDKEVGDFLLAKFGVKLFDTTEAHINEMVRLSLLS